MNPVDHLNTFNPAFVPSNKPRPLSLYFAIRSIHRQNLGHLDLF